MAHYPSVFGLLSPAFRLVTSDLPLATFQVRSFCAATENFPTRF
jgi:hypothetical protein